MSEWMDKRLRRQMKYAGERVEAIVVFGVWDDVEPMIRYLAQRLNIPVFSIQLLHHAQAAVICAPAPLFEALLDDENVLFLSATTIDVLPSWQR